MAEGAADAFKKISEAFATLSDAEKRTEYDKYGTTEGGQQRYRRQRAGREDFVSPEEIFAAFFGGGAVRRGPRGPTYRRQQGQQGQPQRQEGLGQFMHLMPLILLFLMSWVTYPNSVRHHATRRREPQPAQARARGRSAGRRTPSHLPQPPADRPSDYAGAHARMHADARTRVHTRKRTRKRTHKHPRSPPISSLAQLHRVCTRRAASRLRSCPHAGRAPALLAQHAEAPFGFERSQIHVHPQTTQRGVKYFVTDQAKIKRQRDTYYRRKLDNQADQGYLHQLQRQCHIQKQEKRNLMIRAQRERGRRAKRLLQKAHEYPLSSCQKVKTMFTQQEQTWGM